MNKQEIYSKFILFNFAILLFLRVFETCFIFFNSGNQEDLIFAELQGLIYDLSFSGIILLVFLPVSKFLISRFGEKSFYLFVCFYSLFVLLHLLILSYFLYQLQPLDSFLYKYSLKDILFTINTSGLNVKLILLFIFLFFLTCFFIFTLIKRRNNSHKKLKFSKYYFIISIPLFLLFQLVNFNQQNVFSCNKSIFFYSKSLNYYFQNDENENSFSTKEKNEFTKLFIENSSKNNEYPLLHKLPNENLLGKYFEKFDKKPNIVILIIEGLNDDYLHSKDIKLMPFLSKLKDSSLYWEKCFTLGERSFAAVPSLLGSLPYAETGFTLQENFPEHVSLVSILQANNYQTSFYYGQPSWFHNKYNFFKNNFCDEIFDNSQFDKKYKKIIVGKDNYFWGYDDKSLFSQVLEKKAKEPLRNHLDVYFTGSMHSPFISSEDEIYERKFTNQVSKIKPESKKSHYLHYKRFYKSIPFTDDAFKSFFENYKKRADFQNTIFVITGDHPMTEIPPKNLLKRFHVPLLIYSPKLKKPEKFSNIISHLDFYETLLPFLKSYNLKTPINSTALGGNLFVKNKAKKLVFMNGNRELIDYYSNGYYINDDALYKVNSEFEISKIKDEKTFYKMKHELNLFIKNNNYVCKSNKIIQEDLYAKALALNILKSKKINSIQNKNEYNDILENTILPNDDFQVDISFKYEIPKKSDVLVVYSLITNKNKVISWESQIIDPEKTNFQTRLNFKKQNHSEKEIILSVFIWNKKSNKIQVKKLRTLVFKKTHF